jgi:Uri superfamily endonuclease
MERGTYALVVFLRKGTSLQIGRLAIHDFPAGYYVYTGSALGGLPGRLKHHLKPEKRLHWHIDYLLQQALIIQIWYARGQDRLECTWNSIIAALPGAQCSVLGFGSSDCRCSSHLTYFPSEPLFDIFEYNLEQRKLPQARRFSPEKYAAL